MYYAVRIRRRFGVLDVWSKAVLAMWVAAGALGKQSAIFSA
jgi:hypothetical protein